MSKGSWKNNEIKEASHVQKIRATEHINRDKKKKKCYATTGVAKQICLTRVNEYVL